MQVLWVLEHPQNTHKTHKCNQVPKAYAYVSLAVMHTQYP